MVLFTKGIGKMDKRKEKEFLLIFLITFLILINFKYYNFQVYRYANGDIYVGDWKNDQAEGNGVNLNSKL